ncbi:protein phosphatase 1 regulatory subunit 26 [Excalfactoria chinensis]|uniref:protein phosphatase 1 regulatory subunit 26 n=1 Tax=Excalfactoria chinensis TaxID=46218 RepID=UPI003B3A956B
MFLMNASPLVALQAQWESFGPVRNCRYPVCFSESEGSVARTSVHAKVQMIINSLQSQEPPLGMNNECECIMQKKQKGEKGTSNKVASSTTLLQKHPKYTKRGCPADSDDTEENVEFGTLLLDSDSDDSVDRGIEEAIQEYLKAKGKSDQSLQRNAECSDNITRDKRLKREFSQNKMSGSLLPVKFKADMLSEEYFSDQLGIGKRLQPASPQSISSDDSFEQSIQAEIVQFLNEKKQQGISKCVMGQDKKDSHVRSVLKSNRQTTNKTNCGAVKRGCNALLLRHHPKLRKTSTQPKCLKSKIQEMPGDFNQVDRAYLEAASQPWLLQQTREGGTNYWEPREALVDKSMHASDSSSDDGIEEAIQLYQLEKIRKEAGHTMDCVPLQREQLDTKGIADISTSLTISSTKSASPETCKSPTSNKRKEINSKSTELEDSSNDFNRLFKPLKKARHFVPPENKIAACELTLQASCRADTSAELMCAEAILDISKTIMPSQMGSDSKSLAADSFFSPQLLSSSHCESDSSLVDSDDSIEQEIRAFLALKAQSESLVTKPPGLSHSIQMPLPPDQNSLAGTLEPSFPKTLKLSLNRKKRLKREGRMAKQGASKASEQLGMGFFQPDNYSKVPVLQEGTLTSPEVLCGAQTPSSNETEQQQQSTSTELSESAGKCVALDSGNPFLQVQSGSRKLVKKTIRTQEREGSDDESSSLDSDEDLDSAIKDLLRSKRKLKKKSKDQKSQCKKRVVCTETDSQLLDEVSDLQQSEWKCKNPVLLKSCPSKSRKAVKENAVSSHPDNINVSLLSERPEAMKNVEFDLQLKKGCKPEPVSNQNNLQIAKNRKCSSTAALGTDDSSSVDSDDSIEQEIRKFLAEKAKDSASNSEMQKNEATLDLLTKQTANKGKVKQQSVENETDFLQTKKTKGSQQTDELKSSQRTEGKSAMLLDSGKTASSAENVSFNTTGQSKAKQGMVGVKGVAAGELPGKARGKKDVPNTKPVQKKLPPKTRKNEGRKRQKVSNAKPRSKRKNTFQLKISSKFIAGLKHARERKKSMLLNKKQKSEHLLSQCSSSGTEVASQVTNVLKQEKGALLPKGECSGENKTAIKESSSSQKLTVEVSGPHVTETCERPDAAPLYIKEAEGCKKAAAAGDRMDSRLNLPSQEQSVAAGQVDKVCGETNKAEDVQMGTEEGDNHKDSWADSNVGPPLLQQSMAVVEADNVSKETCQQSIHICGHGENNQQDNRPDPRVGCAPQELNVTAVRADEASGEACASNSVHMCVEKEGITCQDSDRQSEIQVSSSSLEGKVLQNREPDGEPDKGQEVIEKDYTKCTDTPAGDSPDSLMKLKVSNKRRKRRETQSIT